MDFEESHPTEQAAAVVAAAIRRLSASEQGLSAQMEISKTVIAHALRCAAARDVAPRHVSKGPADEALPAPEDLVRDQRQVADEDVLTLLPETSFTPIPSLEAELLALCQHFLRHIPTDFLLNVNREVVAPSSEAAPADDANDFSLSDCKDAFVAHLLGLMMGIVDCTGLPGKLSLQDVLADEHVTSQLLDRLDKAGLAAEARRCWAESVVVALALTSGCRAGARAAAAAAGACRRGMSEVDRRFVDLDSEFERRVQGLADLHPPTCAVASLNPYEEAQIITHRALVGGTMCVDVGAAMSAVLSAKVTQQLLGTFESHEGILLQQTLAALRCRAGDFAGAYAELREAAAVQERLPQSDGLGGHGAALFEQLGAVHLELGDRHAALESLQAARRLREAGGTLASVDGIVLLQSIAAIHADFGQQAEELGVLRCAVGLLPSFGASQTMSGAELQSKLAVREWRAGNLSEARCSFEAALSTRDVFLRTATDEGVLLLMHLGSVRMLLEDADGARKDFEGALDILEELGMLESDRGRRLFEKLGYVCEQIENWSDADACFSNAIEICGRLGQQNSVECLALRAKLEEVKAYLLPSEAEETEPVDTTCTMMTMFECSTLPGLPAAFFLDEPQPPPRGSTLSHGSHMSQKSTGAFRLPWRESCEAKGCGERHVV